MTKIFQSVTELIGNTPLIALKKLEQAYDLKANLFAKVEFFNPGGSVKDRAAKKMLEDAEQKGLLKKGATIIEPTSGNTGIGLALMAAVKGYRMVIVMPHSMSKERRLAMSAYGAELVLTEGAKGMAGAVEKAEQLAKEIPNSFLPKQFENKANALAHYETTAPEIWEATNGNIDAFVAGIGTGGTISGVGRYLKEKNQAIQVIGVEPASSPLLTEGKSGSHKIQGIGANFVPAVLQREYCDTIKPITDAQAFDMARQIVKTEGILVGISSGAALAAAVDLAKQEQYAGKNIVVLLPDTGERYFSTTLFE